MLRHAADQAHSPCCGESGACSSSETGLLKSAVEGASLTLEAACDGKFVATFDYFLACEFTNPAMVVGILRWLGMPVGTARLLKSGWQCQHRKLQHPGEFRNTAEPVTTSLPQGGHVDDLNDNSIVDRFV